MPREARKMKDGAVRDVIPVDRGSRPIERRRPRRIPVRMSELEYDGLFAIHAETRKSLSRIIMEAVCEYLENRGKLSREQVRGIMEAESSKRVIIRTPII